MKTLLIAGGLCLVASVFPAGFAAAAAPSSDFTIEAPMSRDGPHLTVRVVSQPAISNFHYLFHLITTDGLDQQFEIRNGQPLTPKDVRLADVNADGFLDIMVVGGKDHRGMDWFKTWLYDPECEKYKWINEPAGCGLHTRAAITRR